MLRSGPGLTVVLIVTMLLVTPLMVQQSGRCSDIQQFRATVPPTLSITSPANRVDITHDETDADQLFPPQQWDVEANAILGATVTFRNNRPFRRLGAPSYQRDVRLDLAIASSDAPAGWTVTVPTDQSDYASGDNRAVVQANSTRPGAATFNLTVTFVTVDYSTLAEGRYQMRVIGTITAN